MECFSGFTSIEVLRQIQKDLNARRINPEQCEVKNLFMLIFSDIDWTKSGNSAECISNAREVSVCAKGVQRGHWSFLGLGGENHCLGRAITSQKVDGTSKPIR